ncbi:MAG: hypothetical protein WC889_12155 [Myxococcota bacterium]
MKQLTIRNVGADLSRALDTERHRRGTSLNQFVLDVLRQALGLSAERSFRNGLGRFSGTWNNKDLAEFEKNTAVFEKIDEEMWR